VEFPVDFVRGLFPAVRESDCIYFDNAAGTQVPDCVIEALSEHLIRRNVQRGGRHRFSDEAAEAIVSARESLASFVNAQEPDEIVFGLNASSLIRTVSVAIAELLKPDDEIVVTELDHEANIAPWLELEKRGIRVKFWPLERETAQLSVGKLDEIMTDRTRVVAVTKASNGVGSIVDLIPVADRIHANKGYLFVDAVQFAPHGPLDVGFLGCDFLVCSGYKIFGPHMGFLWGKKGLLDSLPTFHEFFVRDEAPDKYELGTMNYESVVGMNAAIGYAEELGRRSRHLPLPPEEDVGRRADMRRGMQAIRQYERTLTTYTLSRLLELEHVTLYGLTDPDQAALRTPTFSFSLRDMDAAEVARDLAQEDILVRDGHFYCPRLFEAIGVEKGRGVVRASLVHYNSYDEVSRFLEALQKLRR
jgi:cysteine desulfurase family protein (TIGR01976 family)